MGDFDEREVRQGNPDQRCDTCKYEKSRWFKCCADCSDYELWEAKDDIDRKAEGT